MKWWLISDEAVNAIRRGLEASGHDANDYNCPYDSLTGECSGCDGDKLREVALHELTCGLHETDSIPKDFQEFAGQLEVTTEYLKCLDAEKLAELFHATYEKLAPSFGYETREDSKKDWSEVPDRNKRLMIATSQEVLRRLIAE